MPANEDDLMTVGELARRVGVTVRTIQYYDQKGLLHPSSKSEQNQRLYSRDDEERLYRILTLKYLGFSLAQIKEAEALDDRQELSGALESRMHELERESVEVLRNISTVNSLREQLAASEHVRWSDFAQAISDMQNREDVLWLAINGEGCDESSVPELTTRKSAAGTSSWATPSRPCTTACSPATSAAGSSPCASSASAACPARSPASSASPTSARKAPSSTTATSTRASSVGRSASSKTRSRRCAVRGAKP